MADVVSLSELPITEADYNLLTMETEIKEALTALLAGIKQADARAISENSARLDDLVARGRGAGVHPQLVHFLENRSYAKALMFLGGESDIPAGVCGGGRPKKGGI